MLTQPSSLPLTLCVGVYEREHRSHVCRGAMSTPSPASWPGPLADAGWLGGGARLPGCLADPLHCHLPRSLLSLMAAGEDPALRLPLGGSSIRGESRSIIASTNMKHAPVFFFSPAIPNVCLLTHIFFFRPIFS